MKNWKDIYKLPLKDEFIDKENNYRSKRVEDAKGNFVFQFLNVSSEAQVNALNAINGVENLKNEKAVFSHKEGTIYFNGAFKVISIRGWGNLTGWGGHNLKHEEAANIQDTFAAYVVSKLNER
jgi:hypothetical protein